jgi:hypothetical protein
MKLAEVRQMKNNIRENFRRLWPIVLVWTLFDLIAGPLIALIDSTNEAQPQYMPEYTFANGSAILLVVNVMFTLVIGVAVFRYAHSPSSISVVHALPIRRGALFISNWLSGIIFMAIPQFITTLFMLPFVRMSFSHIAASPKEIVEYMMMEDPLPAAFSYTDAGDLLRALIVSLITTFFVYALTVFAGVITGTTSLHIIVTIMLNAIAPTVYAVVTGLCSLFLYGYDGGMSDSVLSWLSPLFLFYLPLGAGGITGPTGVLAPLLFLVIPVIFSAATYVLYRKLKSERVGRPFTFEIAEHAFVILITLFGMTICALIFSNLNVHQGSAEDVMRNMRMFFYIGAAVGAAVTYFAATMIARKSTRIFDMRLLRNFGICAICAVLFLVATTTDITGYAKRVPAPASVDSVSVHMPRAFNIMPYRWGYEDLRVKLTDESGIEYVTALHKAIANAGLRFARTNSDDWTTEDMDGPDTFEKMFAGSLYSDGTMSIKYRRNSGGPLSRTYCLKKETAVIDRVADLVSSDAWRKATTIDSIAGYDSLNDVSLNVYDNGGVTMGGENPYEVRLTKSEVRELAEHLDADYQKLPASSLMSRSISDEILTFGFEVDLKNKTYQEAEDMGPYFSYSVTAEYTGTIAWLKEKGWYDDMISATKLLKDEWVNEYNGYEVSDGDVNVMFEKGYY